MTTLSLYNTRTRRKETFEPIDPGNVRMYVCGPTVYDRAHLGNARPVIVFDVLNRLLRHVYGADNVTYVRNFTDVDDKINAEAQRRKDAGAPGTLEDLIRERSDETIAWYLEDTAALGTLPPDHMPRATEYIDQMIAMIETLIEQGHAYAAEGHVLFAVDSWKETYGRLSGRSVDDMIAGARVEVAPYKRNPMDFVLWKPSGDDLPGWDGPVVGGKSIGRGRPGWHIECSAMARELLGETFDIHGGGNDLMFPHHENEIAQSCCANGTELMANVWMHNEMLQVEGKKMSKSLGNFFTVRDLLDQGVPGEVIRFVMLSTHYRKPMDWTEKKREEAYSELDFWATMLSVRHDFLEADLSEAQADPQVLCALSEDLNTSLALTKLKSTARFLDNSEEFLSLSAERQLQEEKSFSKSAELLGLDVQSIARGYRDKAKTFDLTQFEHALINERAQAIETKDFSAVDALKSALVEAGVEVQMNNKGVKLSPKASFDPSKLERLK